ncbi:MAG: TOBE domain-containing protein [Bacteroidetes bacterium]|nr:TOBE domain-containing protein [Bacteroidota bacterium]
MNFFEGQVTTQDGLYFEEKDGGMRVEIPAELKGRLSVAAGKEIYMGLRPEHIVPEEEKKGNLRSSCTLNVEISEPMGNEVFLYFQSKTNPIVARVTTAINPKPGTDLKMYFDTVHAHFFDKEKETALL